MFVYFYTFIYNLFMNTKNAIIQATHDLILEKPLGQISVQMIIDRAEVSRGTFYKFFRDKYDAASAYLNKYISTDVLEDYDGTNVGEQFYRILDFVYQDKEFFRTLINETTTNSFLTSLVEFSLEGFTSLYKNNTHKQTLTTKEINSIELFNAGLVYIFGKWVREGCKIPPKEFAQQLY